MTGHPRLRGPGTRARVIEDSGALNTDRKEREFCLLKGITELLFKS